MIARTQLTILVVLEKNPGIKTAEIETSLLGYGLNLSLRQIERHIRELMAKNLVSRKKARYFTIAWTLEIIISQLLIRSGLLQINQHSISSTIPNPYHSLLLLFSAVENNQTLLIRLKRPGSPSRVISPKNFLIGGDGLYISGRGRSRGLREAEITLRLSEIFDVRRVKTLPCTSQGSGFRYSVLKLKTFL